MWCVSGQKCVCVCVCACVRAYLLNSTAIMHVCVVPQYIITQDLAAYDAFEHNEMLLKLSPDELAEHQAMMRTRYEQHLAKGGLALDVYMNPHAFGMPVPRGFFLPCAREAPVLRELEQ